MTRPSASTCIAAGRPSAPYVYSLYRMIFGEPAVDRTSGGRAQLCRGSPTEASYVLPLSAGVASTATALQRFGHTPAFVVARACAHHTAQPRRVGPELASGRARRAAPSRSPSLARDGTR
jgi:hypothetical protein